MKTIDPKEDIDFIKKIIQDSKRVVVDNGIPYIVWGLIIIVGLLSTYIEIVTSVEFNFMYLWIILITGGWAFSTIEAIKSRKRKRVVTFSGRVLGKTWFAVGISLSILGLVGVNSGAIQGQHFSPISAVLMGIAFFLSGTVTDKNWVKIVSYIWWGVSICMFFIDGLTNLLVLALLMFFFQVLPGIIIYVKYNKEMQLVNG